MKFLVHGSIAYDLLLQYDGSFADVIGGKNLEELSVSFFAPHYARHHGGTAANIGWMLALLGQEPYLIGTVGSDGGAYLELLADRGVKIDFIEKNDDHVTATAIIGTDDGERQITFFHPGADAHGSLPVFNGNTPNVHHALVGPRNAVLMMEGAKQCHALGIPYLFDPGQQAHVFSAGELNRAIKQSSGLVVNSYEWSITQKTLQCSEQDIVDHCGLLVITRGEHGMDVYTKDGKEAVAALPAERVVNPTGAGDALRAGLLTGLGAGWSPRDCARLGAALASLVVAQEGTLLEWLDTDELWARCEEQYGEALPALM